MELANGLSLPEYKDENLTETGVIVYINDEAQLGLTPNSVNIFIFDDMSHALEGAKALLAVYYNDYGEGNDKVTARFELQQQTDEGYDRPYMLDTTLTFNPKTYTFKQGRA